MRPIRTKVIGNYSHAAYHVCCPLSSMGDVCCACTEINASCMQLPSCMRPSTTICGDPKKKRRCCGEDLRAKNKKGPDTYLAVDDMNPVDYNKDGSSRDDVSGDWFVGEPILKDLSGPLEINESKIFHVTFPDGAKTKLHYHQGGQLLMVTKGTGSLVIFEKAEGGGGESEFKMEKRQVIELKEGSIQYIPARTLHTHGGVGGSTLAHIAINYPAAQRTGDPDTIWYESDFERQVTRRL